MQHPSVTDTDSVSPPLEPKKTRNRKPKDATLAEATAAMISLPLADKVELLRDIRTLVDAEVSALKQAAETAASLANGI